MSIKVGITMRVVNADNYVEPRDAISHDWIDLLLVNNIEFVLIPNCGDKVIDFLELNKINAIILSNGNDVYDKTITVQLADISKRRDLTEKLVLEWARYNKINSLGVCRGLQLINLIYGGTIEYNLGQNHNAKNHSVNICDPIAQKHFKKTSFIANSFHRHGIPKENLGKDLVPFVISDDGIVEGFYVKDENILAIQWHPERKLKNNYLNNQMPIDFLLHGPWW